MSAEQPAAPPTELTIDDALRIAMQLHQQGHFDPARELYTRILEAAPDHADAVHMLGALHHHQGRHGEGLALIQRSVELAPQAPGFHNNLGNVYISLERLDEALQCYQRAIELDPDRVDALNNLAVLYRATKRPEESERTFLRAIELAPEFADARHNLANLYQQLGRIDEAVTQCCEALILEPRNPAIRELLGLAYFMLKRYDEAAAIYREWLELEPGHPRATHHLAACTGENVPTRASDAYVETIFDGFADSFDAKLAKLTYRAPELVLQALTAKLGEPAPTRDGRTADILDAGCGTGLCGPLIAPYARRLVGVDLSGQMLARADKRGVYDQLVKAELTAYLQSQAGTFDHIVSADTLCYFGALQDVVAAAFGAQRPGGWLVFTVEAMADAGNEQEAAKPYHLQAHGRYCHGHDYVADVLVQSGYVAIEAEAVHLRDEGGKPVHGWLFCARRPA